MAIFAGIGSAASFAWMALKLGIKYGPAVIDFIKSAIGLVKSIEDKIEENKRHGLADKAQETKNPEQLEDYLRGGAPRP
jgi:hypothetical protein